MLLLCAAGCNFNAICSASLWPKMREFGFGSSSFPLMSKKFQHQTSGALVLGCLLATAAHAQNVPAIQAVDGPPVADVTAPSDATAPVPQRVAAPIVPRIATMDMSFNDIATAELLGLLGTQFGINIVVGDDVDGRIRSINLTNQTPEEALEAVGAVAKLSISRLKNGTYVVNKAQPGAVTMPASASVSADTFGTNPITPSPGSFPDLSKDFGGGRVGMGALPPLGAPQAFDSGPSLNNLGLVEVRNSDSRNATHSFKVKNVKPSLIAYWLDPAHNAMPQVLQSSEGNSRNYGEQPVARLATQSNGVGNLTNDSDSFGSDSTVSPYVNPYVNRQGSSQIRPQVRANSQFNGNQRGGNGNGNQRGGNNGGNNNGNRGGGGGGNFDLPGDIQQIVSVDPQNVLLVAGGSDEDIRRLQELIDVLDQPLRQVEIEAQFVELSTADARTFGIDYSTSRGNFDFSTINSAPAVNVGGITLGFVRGNFQARLNALISNNRAKVITAPRVTAINNLTATLVSRERRPLILTSVSQNIGGQQAQQQQLLFITSTTGLTVTPTINGDDTVTVLMQPQVQSQGGTTGLGNQSERSLETVANVRDGDTIALGGLKVVNNQANYTKIPLLGDIPFIGGLFRTKVVAEAQSELIIFLTARIVRRAGDDNLVPGT